MDQIPIVNKMLNEYNDLQNVSLWGKVILGRIVSHDRPRSCTTTVSPLTGFKAWCWSWQHVLNVPAALHIYFLSSFSVCV